MVLFLRTLSPPILVSRLKRVQRKFLHQIAYKLHIFLTRSPRLLYCFCPFADRRHRIFHFLQTYLLKSTVLNYYLVSFWMSLVTKIVLLSVSMNLFLRLITSSILQFSVSYALQILVFFFFALINLVLNNNNNKNMSIIMKIPEVFNQKLY